MVKTDVLRHQHDDALAMVQRLLELIDEFRPGHSAYPIMMQLNRLYGILRVHLAQEDIVLYPRLLASTDMEVVRTARQFVDEMGSLSVDMECFARHWASADGIVSNFAEFREAAHELLLRLAVRVELEDRRLYPLAEHDFELRQSAA